MYSVLTSAIRCGGSVEGLFDVSHMRGMCQPIAHGNQRIYEPVTGHIQRDSFGGRWDTHHVEKYQRNDTAGENPRTPHEISPLWIT